MYRGGIKSGGGGGGAGAEMERKMPGATLDLLEIARFFNEEFGGTFAQRIIVVLVSDGVMMWRFLWAVVVNKSWWLLGCSDVEGIFFFFSEFIFFI